MADISVSIGLEGAQQVQAGLKGVVDNAKQLNDSLTGAGSGVEDAARKFKAFEVDTAKLAQGLGVSATASTAFGAAIGSMAVRIKEGAAAFLTLKNAFIGLGIAEVTRQFALLADSYNKLENRLIPFTRGQTELNTLMRDLANQAKATEQPMGSLVDLYARLALATKDTSLSQKELFTIVQTLSNLTAGFGIDANEAANALTQFAQAATIGRLQGDELRSVLEQFGPLGDIIAKQFGVTKGELIDLGAKGKISMNELYGAILASADEAARLAGTMQTTVAGSFNAVLQEVTNFAGAVDNLLGITQYLSAGFRLLADGIAFAADALNQFAVWTKEAYAAVVQFADALEGKLLRGLINVAAAILTLFTNFGSLAKTAFLSAEIAWYDFQQAILIGTGSVLDALSDIPVLTDLIGDSAYKAYGLAAEAAQNSARASQELGSELIKVSTGFEDNRTKVEGWVGSMRGAEPVASGLGTTATTAFTNTTAAIVGTTAATKEVAAETDKAAESFDKFSARITDSFKRINQDVNIALDDIGNNWDQTIAAMDSTSSVFTSNYITKFGEAATITEESFNRSFDGIMSSLGNTELRAGQAAENVKTFWQNAMDAVREGTENALKQAGLSWENFRKTIEQFWLDIAAGSKNAYLSMLQDGINFGNFFQAMIDTIKNAFFNAIATMLAQWTVTFIKGAIDKLVDLILGNQTAMDAIKAIWDAGVSFVKGLFGGMAEEAGTKVGEIVVANEEGVGTIQGIWAAFLEFMGGIWEAIKEGAGVLWEFLKGLWAEGAAALQALWQLIVEGALSAWELITQGATVLWEALQSLWTSGAELINTVWQIIVEGAQAAWQLIIEGASALWELLQGLWTSGAELINTIWQVIVEGAASAWELITQGATALWEILQGLWQSGAELINTVWQLIVEGAAAAWELITQGAALLWEALNSLWQSGAELINTIWQLIVEGALSAWQLIVEGASALWETLQGLWSSGAEILSSVWATIAEAAQAAWVLIQQGAQALWEAIIAGAQALWGVLQSLFSQGVAAIAALWQTLLTAVQAVWQGILAISQTVLSAIQAAIAAMVQAAIAAWQNFSAVVTAIWQALSGVISSILQQILSFILSMVQQAISAWQNFSSVVTSIWQALSAVINSILQQILSFILSMVQQAISAWQTFASVVTAIWQALYSQISSILSSILSIILSVIQQALSAWQSFGSAVTAIWNAIASVAQSVWQHILAIILAAISQAISAFGNFQSAGVAAMNAVASAAGGIVSALGSVVGAANSAANAIGGVISRAREANSINVNPISIGGGIAGGGTKRPLPSVLASNPLFSRGISSGATAIGGALGGPIGAVIGGALAGGALFGAGGTIGPESVAGIIGTSITTGAFTGAIGLGPLGAIGTLAGLALFENLFSNPTPRFRSIAEMTPYQFLANAFYMDTLDADRAAQEAQAFVAAHGIPFEPQSPCEFGACESSSYEEIVAANWGRFTPQQLAAIQSALDAQGPALSRFTYPDGQTLVFSDPNSTQAKLAKLNNDKFLQIMDVLGYASGGSRVVDSPTVFMAGEAGKERVTVEPLGRLRKGGRGDVNLHISGPAVFSDISAAKFMRMLERDFA